MHYSIKILGYAFQIVTITYNKHDKKRTNTLQIDTSNFVDFRFLQMFYESKLKFLSFFLK